jgi:hypothetical protein
VKPGVYMGVGPEQNFTYIAALKPKMAIITDIRRGNLQLHLMYKALFEMATDRADFVGMLFSKKRPRRPHRLVVPSTTSSRSTTRSRPTRPTYNATFKRMIDHLTKAPHQLPLSKDDIDGIKVRVRSFLYVRHRHQLQLHAGRRPPGSMANYEQLMLTNDGTVTAAPRSSAVYLASEDAFKFMQDLESKNLLVPVVGRLRRPEGDPRRRAVHPRPRRNRHGLLPLERRGLPPDGRHLGEVLQQRRQPAAN